jgi:hypothetical protein
MIGSRVRALMHPPPSPWVETFNSLYAFIAPEWGLFAPACVSAGGLCLAEGPVYWFVSASKISVPRSGGDRFDDWLVGPQFEPNYLHHPVPGLKLRFPFLPLWRWNAGFSYAGESLDSVSAGNEPLSGSTPNVTRVAALRGLA